MTERKTPIPGVKRTELQLAYIRWKEMKGRCLNKKNKKYRRYGGRGIKVCDRWAASFEDFYADVGARPSKNHSLDRIDNDGNYEPGNVRWATAKEQQRNCSRVVLVEFNGESLPFTCWSERIGVHKATLFRLSKQLGHKEAIAEAFKRYAK